MKKLTLLLTIFIATNGIAQIPSYVPTNDLIGWLPFSGNANDLSGNGNNGIVNGATLTADRNGAQDSAYSFNGASDYIAIPTLDTNTFTDFSVSGWFNTDGASGDNQVIFNIKNGRCWIPISDITQLMGANFENNDGSNPVSETSETSLITATSWHHFALTTSGANMKLYFDGVLVDSTASSQTYNDIYAYSEIGASGRSNNSRNNYFDGSIDDIGIWKRTLSASEISLLYNSVDVTSVTEHSNVSATVFPNPTSDVAQLSFDRQVNGYLTINDITGKKIDQISVNGVQCTIDCTSLSSTGIYIVNIYSNDARLIGTQKIVYK